MEIDYKSYIKNYVLYCVLFFVPALFSVEIRENNFARFMEAIQIDDVATFKELQFDVDVNHKDEEEMTPLLCSIFAPSSECFELLLKDTRVDVNAGGKKGLHALLAAAILGNLKIIKKLLGDERVDVDAQDDCGFTALHGAVSSHNAHKNQVVCLLVKKISVDIPENKGYTALMIAVLDENIPAIQCLLQNGADHLATNDKGDYPYEMASDYIKQVIRETLEQMYKVKSDVSVDELIKEIDLEEIPQAVRLLPHIDDINATGGRRGFTPLILALIKDLDIFDLLLADPRLDINATDKEGRTVLIHAVLEGDIERLKKIIRLPNIEIDKPDSEGYTPLIHAVMRKDETIIEILLLHGADPNQKNREGNNSFGLATEEMEFEEMVKKIEQEKKRQDALLRRQEAIRKQKVIRQQVKKAIRDLRQPSLFNPEVFRSKRRFQ